MIIFKIASRAFDSFIFIAFSCTSLLFIDKIVQDVEKNVIGVSERAHVVPMLPAFFVFQILTQQYMTVIPT